MPLDTEYLPKLREAVEQAFAECPELRSDMRVRTVADRCEQLIQDSIQEYAEDEAAEEPEEDEQEEDFPEDNAPDIMEPEPVEEPLNK